MVFKKGHKIGKGRHPSEETKRKISEAHKGMHHTEKSKKKMSLSAKKSKNPGRFKKGHLVSEETIKKQKETFRKTLLAHPEIRQKMSEAQKRRFSSPEARKSQSEIAKKALSNIDVRRKMSIAHLGKPSGRKGKTWSQEMRKKLSEAHKGQIGWMKGKHHTKEARKKMSIFQKKEMIKPERRKFMREKVLKQYQSGQFPKQTNTKIEKDIKKELIKRGYKEGKEFIHQFKFMNRFMCDFCFPLQKVIVEAYGDFWHCNPKIYHKPTHPHQEKGIEKDKVKNDYIKKVDKGSWKLIILWESDINKDVSKCVDKIEKALAKAKQFSNFL